MVSASMDRLLKASRLAQMANVPATIASIEAEKKKLEISA
jgi:hypothetical protein